MDRRLQILTLALALISLQACTTISYYAQSVRGHLGVLSARESVEDLLAQPDIDPELRTRLKLALSIRDYASRELGLPDNDSYRSFVDVNRPHLLWTVFAAPEFELAPKNWCFIFVGCVPYRGYFSEQRARAYAVELAQQGYDVFVGGVAAYSTLGWFDDPLISTMFRRDEPQLAHFIFHELSHQQVYFKDDTAFNEAFAETVAEEGVARWLSSRNDPETLAQYHRELGFKDDFIAWLSTVRQRLEDIYRSSSSTSEKRDRKHAVLAALPAEYAALKTSWDGYSRFDSWFDEPVNNARLLAVGIYRDDVERFKRLLVSCGSDLPRFYASVQTLQELAVEERRSEIDRAQCKN